MSLINWARHRQGWLAVFLAGFVVFGSVEASAGNESAAAHQPHEALVSGLDGVLSGSDAGYYRDVFALQETGNWAEADRLIGLIKDPLLMGHVLYQRYLHPTAYRSQYHELKAWMAKYADHPGAEKIYVLAVKRRPANHRYPVKPTVSPLKLALPQQKSYRSKKKRDKAETAQVKKFKREIRRHVRATRLTKAEEMVSSAEARKLLDQAELDWAYTEIAKGWYHHGTTERALELAHGAAKRSGDAVPDAHWYAGLAAWRLGDPEDAVSHFEAVANSSYNSPWMVAAGAYWAARANLHLREPAKAGHWLRQAIRHKRTFYGLVAASALGIEPDLDFGSDQDGGARLAGFKAEPAGQRVLALLQIGATEPAERELLSFGTQSDPRVIEALLLLAADARLPNLALKLGRGLANRQDYLGVSMALDAALYPIPPWQPKDGFKLDRALIYALVRQESGFRPNAKSRDGARGLMQIMPTTASYISEGKRYSGQARDLLLEPGLNLQLGQRYLSYLLEHPLVAGDLFRLATAYNGGPGNLAKWQKVMDVDDDPLLFIESLPSRETRLFIEKVLASFWIYRQRLGQEAPSREEIASGAWPRYRGIDQMRPEVASHEQN